MVKTMDRLENFLIGDPFSCVESPANVGEETFAFIARLLLKSAVVGKAYLTSHTPRVYAPNTSYRLWLDKPEISQNNHPDNHTNDAINVVEMWKVRDRDTDEKVIDRIFSVRRCSEMNRCFSNYIHVRQDFPEVIVQMSNASYCDGTRIYRLK